MKIFSKNIITKDEISAIEQWSDDSSDIKMSMWQNKPNSEAKILFGLFDKYKSNVQNGLKVYRGLSMSKENYFRYKFNEIEKNIEHTPDNKAIVSFSSDKYTALEFTKLHPYKILYLLYNDNNNLLDISQISNKEEQKELLISKNIWYNVINIKIYLTKDGLWKIVKLKPIVKE